MTAPDDDAFVALPPSSQIIPLAILSLVFAAWFALCYGGAAALAQFIPWRAQVELPIDARLPFWPGAAALYLTIGPALLLAPFVFRSVGALLPLFATLMLETAVAAALFLVFPVDDAPIVCCEPGPSGALFRLADALNLHHNNLPSLHVAFACTLALAYAHRVSRGGVWLLFAWAVAVTASTMFTRQHFLLDLLAGVVLALVCWRLAGPWARKPGVVSRFERALKSLAA
jgi:membrane-associated phospholipid phosphatase